MTIDFHPETFALLLLITVLLYYIFVFRKGDRSFAYLICIIYLIFYILCFIKFAILPISLIELDMQFPLKRYIQWVPFHTMFQVISWGTWPIQIGGNILLFMPVPIFAELLKNKKIKYKRLIKYGLILILGLEITQGIINIITKFPKKVTDIDDVILNIIGITLSYFILKLMDKWRLYRSFKFAIHQRKGRTMS